MFDRIARNIKTKLTSHQNLAALTLADAADFGVTGAEISEAASQRPDVLERVTRMSAVYGAEAALQTIGRYDLFEMARTCDRCPHERKCARLLHGESKPCTKDVNFCPNATEYVALKAAAHAS